MKPDSIWLATDKKPWNESTCLFDSLPTVEADTWVALGAGFAEVIDMAMPSVSIPPPGECWEYISAAKLRKLRDDWTNPNIGVRARGGEYNLGFSDGYTEAQGVFSRLLTVLLGEGGEDDAATEQRWYCAYCFRTHALREECPKRRGEDDAGDSVDRNAK